MESQLDYELVGRMIYGFNRVKGDFDSFCRGLEQRAGEQGAHPFNLETPVRELAERTVPLLSKHYGAGSMIVNQFNEVSDIMAAGEVWFNQMKELGLAVCLPDVAQTARVLSCQQKLSHIRQLMNAA